MSLHDLRIRMEAWDWRNVRNGVALVVVLAIIGLLCLWILRPTVEPVPPALDTQSTARGHVFTFHPHASPRALEPFEFQDAGGATRTLADFRGKVVLLNVWATWCAPCRKEMPTLDHLQARLGGKTFDVVALSIDRDGVPAVKRFFAETKVHSLAIYVDPTSGATEKLAAIGVPTTLLIDAQGREIARWTGPAEWDSDEVIAMIQRYLPSASR